VDRSLVRRVLGEVWRLFREYPRELLAGGIVVFVPLGLLDAVSGSLFDEVEEASDLEIAATVAGAIGAAALSLLGEVLYAGFVAALVVSERDGEPHPLPELVKSLPYGRLIVADLIYVLLVSLGLLLLVVPGLVVLTWFALVAPAVKLEGLGVVEALRRSRALVRPRFWSVFALVVPLALLADALADTAFDAAILAIGDSLLGDWAGSTIAELITAPFLGLVVVVLFLELRATSAPRTPRSWRRRSRRETAP
jgi:hypothetical protein